MKANLKYAMILKINVKKELILHTRKICPNPLINSFLIEFVSILNLYVSTSNFRQRLKTFPLKLKNIFLLKISFYFSITVYIHLFVLVSSVQLSG